MKLLREVQEFEVEKEGDVVHVYHVRRVYDIQTGDVSWEADFCGRDILGDELQRLIKLVQKNLEVY